MNLAEIIKLNKELKEAQTTDLKILYLSNAVIEPIPHLTEFFLRQYNLNSEITLGQFDNVLGEVVSRSNEFDIVIIHLDFTFDVISELNSPREVLEKKSTNLVNKILSTVENIKSNENIFKKVIFVSPIGSFSTSAPEIVHIYSQAFHKYREWLSEISNSKFEVIYLDDILKIIGEKSAVIFATRPGLNTFYSISLLKAFSEILATKLFSVVSPIKKLLVLDCDNVLWNGILGEDGINGIKFNIEGESDEVFIEFQDFIKKLSKSGVLVALSTKNNQEEIENIFELSSKFALDRTNVISIKANWDPKSINIKNILLELNLSDDSCVFIDDLVFELEEVKSQIPSITAFHFESNPRAIRILIEKLKVIFLSKMLTKEDLNRQKFYFADMNRSKFKQMHNNYEEYLNNLEMHLRVSKLIEEEDIVRAAQLSERTNQFNLLQERYSAESLMLELKKPNIVGYVGKLSDRYGDLGTILFVLLENVGDKLIIREFVLSCRAFGRHIAEDFLVYILISLPSNVQRVVGKFRLTNRNKAFFDFYQRMNFSLVKTENSTSFFELQLVEKKFQLSSYTKFSKDNYE